jgi:hypothetical protein
MVDSSQLRCRRSALRAMTLSLNLRNTSSVTTALSLPRAHRANIRFDSSHQSAPLPNELVLSRGLLSPLSLSNHRPKRTSLVRGLAKLPSVSLT